MSKSQISSQIFIYVIAIVLFSFVLIYGYNSIKGFKERGEQISYIKFKTDMTSTVNRISSDYGTLKREEFFLGGQYSKVCFLQTYNPPGNLDNLVTDNIVKNIVEDGVDKNVFLFTTTLKESFDAGEIDVVNPPNGGYLCIDTVNGKLNVQFEGKGDHALISAWPTTP